MLGGVQRAIDTGEKIRLALQGLPLPQPQANGNGQPNITRR